MRQTGGRGWWEVIEELDIFPFIDFQMDIWVIDWISSFDCKRL